MTRTISFEGGVGDVRALRHALGRFATGVTVVTTRCPSGKLVGLTANSFSSVSLDPPLILFCVHQRSRMLDTLRRTGQFVVNILAEHQKDLCRAFAGKETRQFGGDGVAHHAGLTGAPILSDALAYMECRVHRLDDGGDHQIVIGEVLGLDVLAESNPLTFFRNGHHRVGE